MAMESFSEKNVAVLQEMIETLELPEGAYEKAQSRYEDIGSWLAREDSTLATHNPHVFAQGSFRLGTAIYPLDRNDGYDLDLVCNLRDGFSKKNISQKDFKSFSKTELEKYRLSRGIQTPLDEKRRCWCLQYKDDLSFHMDIIPAIPECDDNIFVRLSEGMRQLGLERDLSIDIASSALSITDNRNDNYNRIDDDWHISNPDGYAKWFKARMASMVILSEDRAFKAQIDELPLYKRKTPLQRVIQLLKRHRDKMYMPENGNNIKAKPISIIITTLAAKAYQGQTHLEDALISILDNMGACINDTAPWVPNPINNAEDFADKWDMPKYHDDHLRDNFLLWLKQAKDDFHRLLHTPNRDEIIALSEDTMKLSLSREVIKQFDSGTTIRETPSYKITTPPKPHLQG